MDDQIGLLREIRDLLLVMAEPALAKRDERLREALTSIVGKSKPRARAALLMDGTRPQASIKSEAKIDAGDLSRCVKAMRAAELLGSDEKQLPKLSIKLPPNFFEHLEGK